MNAPAGFPGFAPGEHRHLIADVHRWARTNNCSWGWIRGWINARSKPEATIAVDWAPATEPPRGFTVARRDPETGHWSWPVFYAAADPRQAVDLLVALSVLPPHFSSALSDVPNGAQR